MQIWTGEAPGPFLRPCVEIIATPHGEAPEWVRRAWIGLQLPLAVSGVHEIQVVSVLAKNRRWWPGWLRRLIEKPYVLRGYYIDALAAFRILRDHNADAADWWQAHTPHLVQAGVALAFEERVCRLIPLAHIPPANA